MKIKLILKLIIFVSGLLLINDRLSVILSPKSFPPKVPNVNSLVDKNWLATMRGGFYNEKPNTIDIVFIGSSKIFCNLNPNIIWNQYGITSYDFSGHMQDLGTSYYFLQQMFEKQSPKVVLIDVFLDGSGFVYNSSNAHHNFDFMNHDFIRTKAILNRSPSFTNTLELLIPTLIYHQRWKELTQDDVFYKINQHDFLKGSFIFMRTLSEEGENKVITTGLPKKTLPEKTIHWINAIQELCRKNNCQCIFINTPFLIASKVDYLDWSDVEFYAYLSAFQKYCEENDLMFMNFVGLENEIGLNYADDYSDIYHMNWKGQEKFSLYISKYLQEKFRFENKKGQPGYEQWDQDYDKMRYYIDNYFELEQ